MTTRRKRYLVWRALTLVTVVLSAIACGGTDKASAPSTSKASTLASKRSTSASASSTAPASTMTGSPVPEAAPPTSAADGSATDPARGLRPAPPRSAESTAKAPGLCGRVSYETVVAISGDAAVQGEEDADPDGKGTVCVFRDRDGEQDVELDLYRPDERSYADVGAGQDVDILGVPARYPYEASHLYVDTPEGLLIVWIGEFDALSNSREYAAALAREFLASA